ncbi:MAG TPA: GIY-YIG nuclease family protein [Candidatus Paceibacterota bacterium]
MSRKQYYIYIMTNPGNTTLYTGVTNDLLRRIQQHKRKVIKGFTARYNLIKLVYYELYEDPESAIQREKQIKAGSRIKKVQLIEGMNPKWKDLSAIFE